MNAIEYLPDLLREALGDDLRIARDEFANDEAGAPPSVLWRVTDEFSDRTTFQLECRSQTAEGCRAMAGHIDSYLESRFEERYIVEHSEPMRITMSQLEGD